MIKPQLAVCFRGLPMTCYERECMLTNCRPLPAIMLSLLSLKTTRITLHTRLSCFSQRISLKVENGPGNKASHCLSPLSLIISPSSYMYLQVICQYAQTWSVEVTPPSVCFDTIVREITKL